MMIADRYEIIEKIGTGGMSDVYRAKDHKLNRFVAIKVLKQEFSENSDFVSKFRVEAQAAAGLMHPNIVNVYDVGEEQEFHYIVMELVEGITLKKYIEKKARLSVKEAISIAIQVAMGIEAAHNNHIIHRDIKPQNIIISKEGKVKVTDFGIAKAATSNTITSNVMGSVHYTSPEQVRGGFSDEKSDIYSLGITLYEMLTGRVPFNGETTVAVAIKHIQEPMPSPCELVPEIPISVEQIVLKCTQKSPDRRYQSAPELIEDLKKSLISPDENFVKMDTGEAGGATKNISNSELEDIRRQTRNRNSYDDKSNGMSSHSRNDSVRKNKQEKYQQEVYNYEDYSENYTDDYAEEYTPEYVEKPLKTPASKKNPDKAKKNTHTEEILPKKNNTKKNTGNGQNKKSSGNSSVKNVPASKKNNKKNKTTDEYDPKAELITTILVVIAAVIIGFVFLYVFARALGIDLLSKNTGNTNMTGEAAIVNVPTVVGMDADAGCALLEQSGLIATKKFQESSDVEENIIISTSELSGTKVPSGTEVEVLISSGENGSVVPNVVGKTRAEAVASLEGESYLTVVEKENSETVPKDNVISQEPVAGTKVARGTTVKLLVSQGTETVPVTMPEIIGKTKDEAIAALSDINLVPKELPAEYSDEYPEGTVIFQNFQAGATIYTGTEIEYKLSLGVEQVFYNCYYSVQAPADYAGGDASVVLTGSDGTQLYSSTTSSFPVEINVTNIFAMSSGVVYVSYNVNENQEVVDDAGNTTVTQVQVHKDAPPITVNFTKVQ